MHDASDVSDASPAASGTSNRSPARSAHQSPDHAAQQWRRGQPFVTLAILALVGVMLGAYWPRPWWWLVLALGPLAMAGVMLWRSRAQPGPVLRAAACWGMIAMVALWAGWSAVRTAHVSRDSIARYLDLSPEATHDAQLARVTGTITREPYLRTPERGAFGEFSYMPPATLFRIDLDTIVHAGERVPATGTLLGRIDAADHRLREHMRIEATGWLTPIAPPRNPGEVDFRARLAAQDVHGRLILSSRGNWSLLEDAARPWWRHPVNALRRTAADEARHALRLGMLGASDHGAQADQRRRLALLEALLLGLWTETTREIHEHFRDVGLAHLMAISGAHLGILMWLVWSGVKLATPRPAVASAAVLTVLALYLLVVPWRVPIVRAAIMAGCLCLGFRGGRGVSATGMLALAMLIVLAWRPGDAFTPGFQLSFGIVAALLLFTRPAAEWMWSRIVGEDAELKIDPPGPHESGAWLALRRGIDYLAVSVIAFAVAMPLVAHHFELVNPLAVLMSVLALPVIVVLLGLGYFKMLVGVGLPSVSMALAGPLAWVTDVMLGLVGHARDWPASSIELTQPMPAAWVVAMLLVVIALFAGRFAKRTAPLVTCVAVLAAWTWITQQPEPFTHGHTPNPHTTIRVNMLSVGHGSAYVIRLGDRTFMYDCGSQPYLDVGERTIIPALRRLGVRRIDTLFISHAHLDHYAGVLALVDAMDVAKIRGPPQFIAVAERHPNGSAAYLLAQLEARGQPMTPTAQGWSKRIDDVGDLRIEALWPPADYLPQRLNDKSLVLMFETADRRLLMTGDMEQDAIDNLLETGKDPTADVAELPHHGGWVDSSPDWLEAVSPKVVLQSSAPPRARRDPWADLLADRGVTRLKSYELGMVELTLAPGEPIRWRAFRDPAQRTHELPRR